MKLKCKRKDLYNGFQMVGSVVDPRSTKPILQDIKIDAISENSIELSATDLEVGIKHTIDSVEVKEPGSVVIPSHSVSSILRESSDDDLDIIIENNICHIYGKDSYFKILGESPEEFPEISAFPEEGYIEIDSDLIRLMIKRTIFAVATERIRYALNGVLFIVNGNDFEMVATDGRRLAHIKKKLNAKSDISANAIVPTKAVTHIEKIIGEDDETIKLKFEESQILAKTNKSVLCSQLVDGTFPNYKEVIPTDLDKKFEFNTSELLSGVRRAALLTTEESNAIRLCFEDNKLTLTSQSPEMGEAKIEMDVKYNDEKLEIGFNPDFISDVLKALDDEHVRVELKDSVKPGIIRAGQDYLYVIMPVNIET